MSARFSTWIQILRVIAGSWLNRPIYELLFPRFNQYTWGFIHHSVFSSLGKLLCMSVRTLNYVKGGSTIRLMAWANIKRGANKEWPNDTDNRTDSESSLFKLIVYCSWRKSPLSYSWTPSLPPLNLIFPILVSWLEDASLPTWFELSRFFYFQFWWTYHVFQSHCMINNLAPRSDE